MRGTPTERRGLDARSSDLSTANTLRNMRVYPNPFVQSTTITFQLDQPTKTYIRIYDAFGRLVFKEEKYFGQGDNTFEFNNKNQLPAGVYTIQLGVEDKALEQRVAIGG